MADVAPAAVQLVEDITEPQGRCASLLGTEIEALSESRVRATEGGGKPGFSPYKNGFKRLLDVLAILVAVPVALPIVLSLALMVMRDGGKPFYSQLRIGRNGRVFRMWKLRTMVPDADQQLDLYLKAHPAARAEWDATQKLRYDPRITSFGHFLRRSSLDELPQLWNVLLGDMSLVGPRPIMVSQREIYPGKAYFTLRPGVTGAWQTAGRNRTTFEMRADFDESYAASVSLVTDLAIMWRTIAVVFRGTGC